MEDPEVNPLTYGHYFSWLHREFQDILKSFKESPLWNVPAMFSTSQTAKCFLLPTGGLSTHSLIKALSPKQPNPVSPRINIALYV